MRISDWSSDVCSSDLELVGGILPQAIDTLDTLLPQHQGGRVRILATSGTEREAGLAEVPTFREAGIDLAADGWNAFFAPAAMPQDKVERLAQDIAAVMRDPAMQKAVHADRKSTRLNSSH